ncbi:E3 ubiquitin-protein ligase PPP1R11-like isoform X2 [Physella acuta]|uniref:E3 ubiquitin-protein ligase PPP1R11-like isoform X2 n=1 Tax=Physella acuta TaxID=109671 RepID=UPI0027DCAF15|nr:E3 ubiquitin-protein ligase PPP1R11-like isoform X2 [Physella acuta]
MAESNQSSPNLSQQNQTPSTVTETVQEEEEATPSPPVLQLRLQAKNGHKVKWATDTVDNEFMGKKKSKCCCIYEKPKVFGESDTSSDEDDNEGCTPHCRGHKKKCYRHHKPHSSDTGKDEHNDQDSLHKDGEN